MLKEDQFHEETKKMSNESDQFHEETNKMSNESISELTQKRFTLRGSDDIF